MLCAYSSILMTTLEPRAPCLLFHPDGHLGVICSREQQQKSSKSTSLVHVAAAKEPHIEQMNKWLKGSVGELQAEPTSLCRHTLKHINVCSLTMCLRLRISNKHKHLLLQALC